MIPVIQSADAGETTRRIIHSINYSEDVLAFPLMESTVTFDTSAPALVLGGVNVWVSFAVDRATFRQHLKDARWAVYAAGIVDTVDANTAAIAIQYVKDDGTLVPLGAILQPAGPGFTKAMLGPFDVFGTVGVPPGESIPVLALTAQKSAGADGALLGWVLWLRFLPATA